MKGFGTICRERKGLILAALAGAAEHEDSYADSLLPSYGKPDAGMIRMRKAAQRRRNSYRILYSELLKSLMPKPL